MGLSFSIDESTLPKNMHAQFIFLGFDLLYLNVLFDNTGADPPDVQFNPQGYLFLASESGVDTMRKNHEIQTYDTSCMQQL